MFVRKNITYLFSIATALIIGACASNIKPVDIPATANPTAEVDSLATDLNTARTRRVDVLAPANFLSAEKRLKEAQEKRAKGKKGEDILEEVGYGRAYLNTANAAAARSETQLSDIMKARDLAVAGGAHNHHEELTELDRDLKDYTSRIEQNKQIDREDISKLQGRYLDLELKSIKTVKLSEARNNLNNAQKQGAEKTTPKAFQESKEKLVTAEKTIETDRHNQTAVNQASTAAVESSRRTMALLQTTKDNKNRTPEQIAREIESRNTQIGKSAALTAAAQAEADARGKQMAGKDQQLADQRAAMGAQLSSSEKEREALEKREQFNKVFEQARLEFKKEEADVYRQGDNMIIRLKSMKFSTGRSDLPSASMPVLNKVKDVIGQLQTENIIVEGHTDSTGSAEINKRLSAERASAVADYFKAENTVPAENVESIGYGFEKPIASNKSKSGREMNRRVDIVVKSGAPSNETPSSQPDTTNR